MRWGNTGSYTVAWHEPVSIIIYFFMHNCTIMIYLFSYRYFYFILFFEVILYLFIFTFICFQTPAELQAAHRFIEAALPESVNALGATAQGSTPYTRTSALRNLQRMRAILRGAAPILRPAAVPHTTPFSPEPERADHRGWCATTSPPVIAGAYPPQFLLVCLHFLSLFFFFFSFFSFSPPPWC